jgi:ArsR family transcriptional regulator
MTSHVEANDTVARAFKAMGHPTRVHLLKRISTQPLCVMELQRGSDRSQSNISQHLRVLREGGLVVPERQGNLTCYRLADERVKELLTIADSLF